MGALPVEAERDAERAQLATDHGKEKRREQEHAPTHLGGGRMHDDVHDRGRNREEWSEDNDVRDRLVKEGLWVLF